MGCCPVGFKWINSRKKNLMLLASPRKNWISKASVTQQVDAAKTRNKGALGVPKDDGSLEATS